VPPRHPHDHRPTSRRKRLNYGGVWAGLSGSTSKWQNTVVDHPEGPLDEMENRQREELKAFLGAGALILSVLGALTFGAQRIAYERFYDQFGVAPEDVGVDISRVLSQTAGGLALMLLAYLAIWGLWLGVSTATNLLGRSDEERRRSRRVLFLCLAGALVFIAAAVLLINTADADDAARCAARPDGQSVRALRWRVPHGPTITRLGVWAERAIVRSTDPALDAWNGRQVIYLGTADGVATVYDPRNKRAIRLPAASLAISINAASESFQPTQGCQPLG
jgi:hypothetical protein